MKSPAGSRRRLAARAGFVAIVAVLAGHPGIALGGAAPLEDIGRRLPVEQPRTTDSTPLPRVPAPAGAVQSAPEPFILTAVTIRGSTIFAPSDFAPLYEPYLTRQVGVADVAKLAERITEKYRGAGFFLSRAIVPAQDAAGGLLSVNIVEGYIDDVVIENSDRQGVRDRAEALVGRRPLRLADIERTLSLIADMPGISISASRIEPDPVDLSAHRLVLSIEFDRGQNSVYVDNRAPEAVGRLQTYLRASLNSILRDGDQLSVGVFTTPSSFEDLMYAEAGYSTIVNRSGTSLTASAGLTSSDADANLFGLHTKGEIARVSFLASHPFIRGRELSLWGNLGLEGRNLGGEQFGLTVYDERLRLVTASLNLRHSAGNGITTAFIEASRGLGGLGASDADDTRLSRIDARAEFLKVELLLSRYQNIGQAFGLYVAAAGQISSDPLPASEEFAVGGAQFGRAYDYSAILGDHGASGLVELRYGRETGRPFLKVYQLYGYYDIGWAWNRSQSLQPREASIASVGAGFRLTLPGSLFVTYESAWPVSQTPYMPIDYAWRNYFSISANF
jgi:hemolysin activation/secretion protein